MMLENVDKMYDGTILMLKKLNKKKVYEARVASFRENYGAYYDEMLDIMHQSESEGKAAAAKSIADDFTGKVFDRFQRKGKVRDTIKSDITMFTIYYVIPSLLLTGDEDAAVLAEAFKVSWADRFNIPGFGYTTYEELYANFKEKVFGLF